jgi:hypothetical protein
MVLVVDRNTASRGNGRIEHRGVLLETDLVRANDGSVTLAPSAAGNVSGIWTSYYSYLANSPLAGTWVLPRPQSQRNLPARQITSFSLAGVRHRQQSVKRVSLTSARARYVQRELNALAAQARKLQRQVAFGIATFASILGSLQAIWDSGMALFNALPVLLRGLVRFPAFFGAGRPALGA